MACSHSPWIAECCNGAFSSAWPPHFWMLANEQGSVFLLSIASLRLVHANVHEILFQMSRIQCEVPSKSLQLECSAKTKNRFWRIQTVTSWRGLHLIEILPSFHQSVSVHVVIIDFYCSHRLNEHVGVSHASMCWWAMLALNANVHGLIESVRNLRWVIRKKNDEHNEGYTYEIHWSSGQLQQPRLVGGQFNAVYTHIWRWIWSILLI